MSRILVPSAGPDSWRAFLAKPELHWATGNSARTLAYAWEASDGIPPEVLAILTPVVGEVEPLIVVPEHKTPLPGGRRESQADVFLLARHSQGTIACTIEGKVDEPFGPTVGQQIAGASDGRKARLAFLCEKLGLAACPDDVRYQLLHRSVSALIEADRFCSADAAMIFHSFSPDLRWFDAFAAFVELLGGTAVPGEPIVIEGLERRLILGWACGDQHFRSL